jgi:hypothetical protein
MQRKRDSEENKVHFQMDRFYQLNGEWFYMTREGEEMGPFISKQDAKGDLCGYILLKHRMEAFCV